MNINIGFGPQFINPEEMLRQQMAMRQQMVDDKRCEVCKNTYLINDQITMCSIKNTCVDGCNGQECENWEVLE